MIAVERKNDVVVQQRVTVHLSESDVVTPTEATRVVGLDLEYRWGPSGWMLQDADSRMQVQNYRKDGTWGPILARRIDYALGLDPARYVPTEQPAVTW